MRRPVYSSALDNVPESDVSHFLNAHLHSLLNPLVLVQNDPCDAIYILFVICFFNTAQTETSGYTHARRKKKEVTQVTQIKLGGILCSRIRAIVALTMEGK